MGNHRISAMQCAIDAQKIRQLQDRFAKVTECLSRRCEELETDAGEMEAAVAEDRRRQQLRRQQAQAGASSSTDAAA